MRKQQVAPKRTIGGGLLCLTLLCTWTTFLASAADKIDTDAIKRKYDEDLERHRRQAAEQELLRLRERRHDLESRLEYSRQWALTNYGMSDRGLIRRPAQMPARLLRHEEQKKVMLVGLLEQRERFRGSIAKGTALNFLLQECGGVAFDHKFYKDVAKGGAGRELEQKLLQQVSAQYQIDEDTTRHIRYQRGLVGSKLVGRLNEGPLDLEWPSVLRQSHYEVLVKTVEMCRDRIVTLLKNKQPVDGKTADELLDTVQEMFKRVRGDKLRLVPKSHGDYQMMQRYYAADRFCQLLVAGAYRLIEARDIRDVTVESFDHGSIEDLLALMHRNNLTFAESDPNGESAYNTLFELMSRYYVDLQSLRLAIEEDAQELATLKTDQRELSAIVRGDRLSNVQKTELGLKGLEAIISGFEAYKSGQDRRKIEALTK